LIGYYLNTIRYKKEGRISSGKLIKQPETGAEKQS
jgi:hypothetical protein